MSDTTLPSWLESIGPELKPHLTTLGTTYLPIIIKVCAILVLGYLLSKVIKRVAARLLKRIHLDALCTRIGLLKLVQKLGIASVEDALPRAIAWITLGGTLYLAADVAHITMLKNLLGAAIAFTPTLLVALAILTGGVLGAEVVKQIIHKALLARSEENELSAILPQGVYAIIVTLTGAMAADQLGLDITLVNRTIVITIAAITLGLGLATGLGALPMLQQLINRYHVLRTFKLEDELSIDGHHGKIVRFAPTAVMLEMPSSTPGKIERLLVPYSSLIRSRVTRKHTEHVRDDVTTKEEE